MPDSSDIDAALVTKLSSDTALLALAPNGVYFDQAPAGSTAFVIVSLIVEDDIGVFQRRGYEDALYLVEFRERKPATGAGNAKAAAARIDALLEDQPLTVAGFVWMTMSREHRERHTEVDDLDASIKWNRRGGQYRVQMSVAGS